MRDRFRLIDAVTGKVFEAERVVDRDGEVHFGSDCSVLPAPDRADAADKSNADWDAERAAMVRELMLGKLRDGAIDLNWALVAQKVGAAVDCIIAEMRKGAQPC